MKKVFYPTIFIIIILTIISLTPVNYKKENCIKVTGIVKSVSKGGTEDLVFKLENDSVSYYINRGFQSGFEINAAKKDFEGKRISLYYAKNWTILAPFGSLSKHISNVSIMDSVIYSEW